MIISYCEFKELNTSPGFQIRVLTPAHRTLILVGEAILHIADQQAVKTILMNIELINPHFVRMSNIINSEKKLSGISKLRLTARKVITLSKD